MKSLNLRACLVVSVFALLVSGCGNSGQSGGLLDQAEYNESFADMAASAPPPAPSSTARPEEPRQQSAENPTAQSFLAYRYNYAFALPAKAVAATAESHAQRCHAAGPDICQVLNSNASTHSTTNVNAYLSLRAEPKWLEGFSKSIITGVEAADGDLTNKSVSAEDLTRQILDTDARLNAQKTLRDRLERLLETKDAKLEDLLALEREFARVQGDIESATTTLRVLRKRVSMSVVDINYQSQQVAVSRNAFSPIGRALKGFTSTFSRSIAGVIDFTAAVLPWLILLIPGLWFLRLIWRRWRKA